MRVLNKIKKILNRKWIIFRNTVYLLYFKTYNRNKDFTIISNNCWGGGIYEDLSLPYTTPIVGLYFYARDYVKFVKGIRHYLDLPLQFTDISKYREVNIVRKKLAYPVGVLEDVEVQFLHYKTNEEALEKWNRRKKRVNFDNLYLKFDDRDGADLELIKEFDQIENVKNKVVFAAQNHIGVKSLIYLPEYEKEGVVGDLYTNRAIYRKHFDVVKWLNS